MLTVKSILILMALVAGDIARAGDAVAFDYETGLGGIYYSSSSEDGADYRTAVDAREPALAMAKKRGGKNPLIIHQSNLTGFFCLVVGYDDKKHFVAYVGSGENAAAARTDAERGLKAYGA